VSDQTTLAACPFCGGKGFWQSEHDDDGFGVFWAIRCDGCGNGTQQHYVSNGNDCPQFRAEVRGAWNRRASANPDVSAYIASLAAERDELREALAALVDVISAAGLYNLSRGVELGPTVWFVKASDCMDAARKALSAKEPT
jgi:hypothetical protein